MPLDPNVQLHLVETFDEAQAFMRWLGERRSLLAVDTETGGLEYWRQPLRTVQFGDTLTGWCIPFDMWKGIIKEAIERYEGPLVFQNIKFDLHFIEHNGITVPKTKLHDTRAMGHLLDPTKPTGLKQMSVRYVDKHAASGELELKQAMAKYRWTYATIPWNFPAYWQYAALDTVITAALAEVLWPKVQPYRAVYDVELASTLVLYEMERRGVRVDLEYCKLMQTEWGAHIEKLRQWCKDTFQVDNPTANTQVMRRLTADGVELVKRTPTGQLALTDDVLKDIDHPLAKAVRDIRKYTKLLGTYVENFIDMADDDSMLHPSINPLGARTGRMSIKSPALQTLPRGPEIRDAFIPRPDRTMLLCDFDQIELRLMAHFSGDTQMIEAIRAGQDLHTYTAALVYHVEQQGVEKWQRQLAKNAGFAKIYGAGINQFARTAGVDVVSAKQFLDGYDREFPGVRRFQVELARVVQERSRDEGAGYVTSPLGRRHPVEPGEAYKGVNYLIQGTAADVLKLKLVELDMAGVGEFMVLPVHDELVFDVPNDQLDDVQETVLKVMEEHQRFMVPLTISQERASRWGEKYR